MTTYNCYKCNDEVFIPNATENAAKNTKIVCEDCVDEMDGTRMGDFFIRDAGSEDD